MPTIQTLTEPMRHATDRSAIVGRLADIHAARLDIVGPQSALGVDPSADDPVRIALAEPLLTDSGVHAGAINAAWTRTAWRNVAERLRIPLAYLDRLNADGYAPLAATNINVLTAADTRTALYRLIVADDAVALSAVLSDRYLSIDNLDVLTAVATGMTQADQDLGGCEVSADWTNDRFRMRIAVPQVGLAVPDLLADYRMPFSTRPDRGIHDPAEPGETPPVMWAGIEVANSETGGGALTITPRAVIQVCRNGMTRPVDMVRSVHAGARLDQGAVAWSTETYRTALALITSQIADATRQFVSVEYLTRMADEMRAAKGIAVESPTAAVEQAQRMLGFTDEETKSVLDAFIRGGDLTVLGVAQAVTAAAQQVDDGDRQAEMEAMFWDIVSTPKAYA